MNQLLHYLSMGKYALYVWPAYALALGIFLMHCLSVRRQKRRVNKELRQWFNQ